HGVVSRERAQKVTAPEEIGRLTIEILARSPVELMAGRAERLRRLEHLQRIDLENAGQPDQGGQPRLMVAALDGSNRGAGETVRAVRNELGDLLLGQMEGPARSEERRVGKECRSGWVGEEHTNTGARHRDTRL